ncbi:hypothetical protein J4205_02070 [Candidatus Pacearchaeota archaeon]|nr:hypothetical protein [Candidatus Pacearchaeota archaeon]
MFCICNPNYISNLENGFYVHNAEHVDMTWIKFREMYQGLHPEIRKEFDVYLLQVESMKTWAYVIHNRELRNRPSKIMPLTRTAA